MDAGATALGWKSAIFNLGEQTLDDVSRSVASGTSIGTRADATRAGAAIETSRTTWTGVLDGLRSGGGGDDAARGLLEIADQLDGVGRKVPGTVAGHARSASVEASAIADVVRGAGSSTPVVNGALQTRVWNFRFHLDSAWQELGMAKVMGDLR